MTDRREEPVELAFGAELALQVIESWREAVVVTDAVLDEPGPRIVAVNDAFCSMCGWPREDLIGRSPRVLQGPGTDALVLRAFRRALENDRPFSARTFNYRRDGREYVVEWRSQPLRDSQGELCGFVSLQRDVTSDVFRRNRAWEAWELDVLTRCSHREIGIRRLEMELRRSQRYGSPLSMMLLEVGEGSRARSDRDVELLEEEQESVLRGTGRMLMNRTRSSDLVVRWAPDCFLVLLPNTGLQGARNLAEGMAQTMSRRLDPDDMSVAGCVSVTECRQDDTPQTVIARLQLELRPLASVGHELTGRSP